MSITERSLALTLIPPDTIPIDGLSQRLSWGKPRSEQVDSQVKAYRSYRGSGQHTQSQGLCARHRTASHRRYSLDYIQFRDTSASYYQLEFCASILTLTVQDLYEEGYEKPFL